MPASLRSDTPRLSSRASAMAARRAVPDWLASVTRMHDCVTLSPPGDRNPSALPHLRGDLELVDQAPRTAQAHAQPAGRGVAVFERQLDIRNTGAAVFEGDA